MSNAIDSMRQREGSDALLRSTDPPGRGAEGASFAEWTKPRVASGCDKSAFRRPTARTSERALQPAAKRTARLIVSCSGEGGGAGLVVVACSVESRDRPPARAMSSRWQRDAAVAAVSAGAALAAAALVSRALLQRAGAPAAPPAPPAAPGGGETTILLASLSAELQAALSPLDADGNGQLDAAEIRAMSDMIALNRASASARSSAYKLALDHAALAKAQGVGAAPVLASSRRIHTVCLTGGPCSGKSSSLASFTAALTARGLDVYSVPEAPTLIMNAGFPYPGLDGGALLMEFELALARTQLQLESTVRELAAARDAMQRGRPAVVFFDRGLMDMKGYMSGELWAALLAACGLEEATVHARYDLVVHLETAAIGAERFYTVANNAARTEGLAEARENDARVKAAWAGHPNWRHVPNRQGATFEDKMKEATAAVLGLLGLE